MPNSQGLIYFTYFLLLLLFAPMAALSQDSISEKRQSSSLGMGLSGLADWTTQFPFLDLMKSARNWYDWSKQTTAGIEVDEHDWVVGLSKGAVASSVFLTTVENEPVVYPYYIVRWQGKGQIKYEWCAKKVGRAHGGDRIQVSEGSCLITITRINKKDPIRNITIVPEAHLAVFDQGERFNPDFINKIGQFRVVRFMDWMNTNDSKQQDWVDRPHPLDRSFASKGVPIEVMVELANSIQAEPWFNMPHLATTDYMTRFAQLVQSSLDPNLSIYLEHSNETWNWVFSQTHHALASVTAAFGEQANFFEWQGIRTAKMCDIWKQQVFTKDSERVLCVLGVQGGWPGLEEAALNCPSWSKQGNGPCHTHGLDAIAITAYFSGCLDGTEDQRSITSIKSWWKNKSQGMRKAYEQVVDGRHFPCENSLRETKKNFDYFADLSAAKKLKLLAYEGGQHITGNLGPRQDDQELIRFHVALNRHPLMKELYRINFDNWKAAGGQLFIHFVDVSSYNKHGSWGALEYITQATSPKWEAIVEANKIPCWWQECK